MGYGALDMCTKAAFHLLLADEVSRHGVHQANVSAGRQVLRNVQNNHRGVRHFWQGIALQDF